jgi:hypothetical protein
MDTSDVKIGIFFKEEVLRWSVHNSVQLTPLHKIQQHEDEDVVLKRRWPAKKRTAVCEKVMLWCFFKPQAK